MSILVTGATGFIGSHLCKELVRRGQPVFALSRSGRTDNIAPLLPHPEFYLYTGDIQDTDMIGNIIKNHRIKAVFHLAAKLPSENDINNPLPCFDSNARGTLNVLDAARQYGVDKFVFASTMSVYAEPPQYLPVDESHPTHPSTIYSLAKIASELSCNLYSKDMSMIVLRYSGAYGRGERESDAIPTFITQALANKPLTVEGDGKQTSDFVHIDDIVQGTLLAWERNEPGVYNLGSGQETSVSELAWRIIKLTDSKSKIAYTDRNTERPFRFFLDITRAQKTFGYSPRSLDEGLSSYLNELNVV